MLVCERKQEIHIINKKNVYVTVPGKRDQLGNFFKIELLLQQERVGFELQNALHTVFPWLECALYYIAPSNTRLQMPLVQLN